VVSTAAQETISSFFVRRGENTERAVALAMVAKVAAGRSAAAAVLGSAVVGIAGKLLRLGHTKR
jgi:hypothetical protein